ncbi:PAS domain S-box protein [Geovibrio thiophilus]|uniref:PAS domain S-box protein n=1 Tax=Geovibrio thiophilus TaxID=139438 RepID=A0A3R5Y632_9BACT|nr:PAS domain S-box protein [Geovibrio thiophilus]QAR32538.1 PAS domain S-box protein [Geovibrio thiophilus]
METNFSSGLTDFGILTDSDSIIIVTDKNRCFLYVNKEAEKFLSLYGSEFCGRFSSEISDSLSPSYVSTRSITLSDPQNNTRTFRFTRIPMNGSEGKYLCVGTDITESTAEEEGAEGLPDILETVTEHLPSGVVILDSGLKVKFANAAAVEMLIFGSRENWFNRNIKEFFAGKLVGDICFLYNYNCPFEDLLKTGKAFYNELFCSGKERETGYVSVSASLSRDATGRVSGIVCTLEDCTDITKTRKLLEKSENKYRLLTEFSPMGILVHENMRITYINPAGAELLGFDKPEDAFGEHILDFSPEHDKQMVESFIVDMVKTMKPSVGFERALINKRGREMTIKMSSQPYESGNGVAVQSVFRDVTQEKKRGEEIMKLSLVVEQSPVSVIITDSSGHVEYVNPAFCEISGYTAAEIYGKNINILKSGVHPQEYYHNLWETIRADRTWSGELCSRGKYGDIFWELSTITPVKCSEGRLLFYVAVKENITEKKLREEKIRHMAMHDILTGLPNRFLMRDRLETVLERVQRYGEMAAVLFIDLDGFKNVNDSFGHKVGDDVLKETARRILTSIRTADTACRIGGDEFLVILSKIENREKAGAVARRIIEMVARPYGACGDQPILGASIGISIIPDDGTNIDELVSKADSAMYDVKHGGKNGLAYFFDFPK